MSACPSLRFGLNRGILLLSLGGLAATTVCLHGQTLHDFGNPTAEEQLYVELINRARANPPAEGARMAVTTDPAVLSAYAQYGVNLTMMQTEFNAIAAQAPLAPNANLTAAARGHSAWMLAYATQSHNETNPSNTFAQRIVAAGYSYSSAAENVYAYSNTVWFGHVGYQVDWGPGGTGGMQPGRGHRTNIHNGTFREIGVGVTLGSNGTVGPQLVTQDFGYRSTASSLATGVAYYDLNNNNFYDVGEGIPGLTVNVAGASHYCTTAVGGGWVVPIPSNAATREVSFTGPGLNQQVNLVVPSSKNAKADLKLSYAPPAITSPGNAYQGIEHSLSFNAVGGASSYRWKRWNLSAAAPENCESTAGITSAITGGYSVRNINVKQQGTSSLHLETTNGTSQSFELNGLYFGHAIPTLSFQSRIRYATTTQKFKVQVKEEGGATWTDVFSQAGSGGAGESSFTLRSAALGSMAGKAFRVRFLLSHAGGYYTTSGDIVGWFIDAISFSGASSLTNSFTQLLAGTSGTFTPSAETYLVSVAPLISNNEFPASYQTLIVTDPPPAPPEPSFATWAAELEASHALVTGTLSNPNGDPDHDGRSNLIEYAFGGSPVASNDPTSGLPAAHSTETHFILRYQRNTLLTDLTFTPQTCPVISYWKAPGEPGAPSGFTDELISTAGGIETREAKIPRSSLTNCFMRLRISRQ